MCIYAYTLVTSVVYFGCYAVNVRQWNEANERADVRKSFQILFERSGKKRKHTQSHTYIHTRTHARAHFYVNPYYSVGVLARLIKEPNQFACGDSIYQKYIVNRCGCCCCCCCRYYYYCRSFSRRRCCCYCSVFNVFVMHIEYE